MILQCFKTEPISFTTLNLMANLFDKLSCKSRVRPAMVQTPLLGFLVDMFRPALNF